MKITQDDFAPQYVDTSNDESKYPKIILWATETPIDYRTVQITATVLQRKKSEDAPWEFIPTVKPSDPYVSQSDDMYGTDKYASEASINLPATSSFSSALEEIENKISSILDGE